jgi:Zn-dependent proteases
VCSISDLEIIKNGFDFSYLLDLVSGVIPSLLCITLHEFSHGYVAYRLGDDTAKRAGRLTLNPIKHLDPVGLLMMLVFHFGWAKPVPVNMYRFKNPKKGMAITALAGPVSNVLIALVFLLLYGGLFIPLQGSRVGNHILDMVQLTAYMSLGLAIFNMIPIPPLDGSKVLFSLISEENYRSLMRYERYGGLALMALAWTGVLSKPLSAAIRWVFMHMLPLSQWICDIIYKLFYQ